MGLNIQDQGFAYHYYADGIQLHLIFLSKYTTDCIQIPANLANLPVWMKDHQLQLNLSKTELLVFPASCTLHYDITEQLGPALAPLRSARELKK